MTTVARSAPQTNYGANVVYSNMLMARALQRMTFLRALSGAISMNEWSKAMKTGGTYQTSNGHAVVIQHDLAKMAGDQVTFDIVDRITGKPVMGDRVAKNRGSNVNVMRDYVQIDQSRKVIDSPGRMAQQRAPHNYRKVMQGLGVDYLCDLQDNVLQVHFAGARGNQTGAQWKVPTADDPEFAEILVNPVTPPTRNRYVGLDSSITSPEDLETTDTINLNFFDRLRTISDTSAVPLQALQLEDDKGVRLEGENSGLLGCFVSTEQWNQLKTQDSGQNLRRFEADALKRDDLRKHRLFRNREFGIWRDIAIFPAPRAIEFAAGDLVSHYDVSGALQQVQAGARAHRGVLFGAQALACAYGRAQQWAGGDYAGQGSGKLATQDVPYSWVETVEDGGNKLQLFAGVMNGMKKLTYTFEGERYDNGAIVFDTHVPPLQ